MKPLTEHHENLVREVSERRKFLPDSHTPQTVLFPTESEGREYKRLDVRDVEINGSPYLVGIDQVPDQVKRLLQAGDNVFVVPMTRIDTPSKPYSEDHFDPRNLREQIGYHIYFSSRQLEVKAKEEK